MSAQFMHALQRMIEALDFTFVIFFQFNLQTNW